MSRLDKKSILIPSKVQVELDQSGILIIKGPLGLLKQEVDLKKISIEIKDNTIKVLSKSKSNISKSIQGMTFILLSNCIRGVQEFFVKKLQLQGVGFKAKVNGSKLELSLGKSHPISYVIEDGVKVETPTEKDIIVSGNDKQRVGQVAANIRRFKEPEPYKGKGIRYFNEVIELKETKSSKK